MHRAQQVGSERHRQASRAHDLQRLHAGQPHRIDLGDGLGADAECLTLLREFIEGDQRGYREGTLTGGEFRCLWLDQIAMLQLVHATFDGAPYAVVGIKMGGDVGSGIMRFLDRGCDLLARKAQEMDRIGG